MKSVLISIQPKWCELIASGKKTIEVRKTKPKLETPFKVYIYCTKPKKYYKINNFLAATDENLYLTNGKVKMSDGFEFWAEGVKYKRLNGKVIGEFVCDEITGGFWISPFSDYLQKQSCLSYDEVCDYANGKPIFAWHISNLVIYDKPRELREFYRECERPECEDCPYLHFENTPNSYEGWCECDEKISIKRPPQSWCYVESGATDTNVGDKSRGGNGNEKKP